MNIANSGDKMKVKIDLSKDGLAILYRPYEILAWKVVRANENPVGSLRIWIKTKEGLKKLYGENATISRASVIQFLNREVDKGFMGYNEGVGKGGYHRLYFPRLSEREILQMIMGKACEKLSCAMGKYR